MIKDHTGNTAVSNAYSAKKAKKEKRYREGLTICKQLNCTRIVDGKCLGWEDPFYMWEHYGECPYFSDDKELVERIELAVENYEKSH